MRISSLQYGYVGVALFCVALYGALHLSVAEAVTIVNTVSAHANTGGSVSTDGLDGEDGADGRPGSHGADGKDGADGVAGTPVFGNASASVRVESWVDGEKVIDIQKSATGAEAASAEANTRISSQDADAASGSTVNLASGDASAIVSNDMPSSSFLTRLTTLHVTLFEYVFALFS